MNMKKIIVLLSISLFSACGLQVRGTPTTTTLGNPNTNGGSGDSFLFTVGGQTSGLPERKNVTLSINGNNYTIDANGSFTFPQHFSSGTNYDVNVETNLGGAYTCSLQNDVGAIANANVTNVLLTCSCQVGSIGTGTGTVANPVLVYTAAQLNTVSTTANATSMGQYYKQVCDLEYTGINPKPIGSNSVPFDGSYDGDGWFILHYTSGAATASLNDNKGLFGKTQNAILKNINFSDINLTADAASSAGHIGALAGVSAGSAITNVYAENVTIHDNSQALGGVGGLIGSQTKYNCGSGAATGPSLNGVHVTNANIYTSASSNVGGVIGISEVDDSGNIQGDDIHIYDCSSYCGGLIGFINGKAYFHDMNGQNITVEGNERVGGVTGQNFGVIDRAGFVGTVNGKTTAGNFGGLIGFGTTSDPLRNSYTVSDIMSVTGTTAVGRVTGAAASISNIFFDNTQTCQNCSVAGGTGTSGSNSFTTGSSASMNTWDFATVWCLVEEGYPQLVSVPFSKCE
jgi:hypothetical protein